MNDLFSTISQAIIDTSDFVCGVPEFLLLIGGGLFLFVYSGAVSLRRFPWALRELRKKQANDGGKQEGQISSFQALMSAIAATVGMGNIAGVAIAVAIGGPGVVFWMWVSALVGMTTKFFEGTLAIMYRGKDTAGETQGGTMYMITEGLGKKFKFLAIAFTIFGMVGTLCFMQANQLTESIITVSGIESSFGIKFGIGVAMAVIVGFVILGGIGRIAKAASRIVPVMVVLYFLMVLTVVVLHYDLVPAVFASIFEGAFNFQAGFGAFVYVALTGAKRAAFVNEAGVGTASMMHGASKNNQPVREGLIAMLGPLIDSGIVCTLTSIPIIMASQSGLALADDAGLKNALGAFNMMIPNVGQYLLMAIVFFFAFSTMFSYSYYGLKCTNYLFGAKNAKYYNYYYLVMIVVAAVIKLNLLVGIMDLAFAGMAVCTMFTLIALAPKVKEQMKIYFAQQAK
ncbi:MAG: alanine/glycine:cation symporter family protein [Bacteroidales bacterium]|nr:alanine/glycine:cation symporter family protein [Bacteroidales bacterium]